MKMKKTYAKLLIFMAMAAALIESEPWRIRMRQSEWRRR